MLRFELNALRLGDRVAVHDDRDPDLGLHQGVVRFVDRTAGRANDVGVRLDETGELLRPRRRAVHRLPVDPRLSCWRCDLIAAHGSAPVLG